MNIIHANWTTAGGNPDGGVVYGHGFCISWQRGPLEGGGRNGAFLLEVLEACRMQLLHYQGSKFACDENQQALADIEHAIAVLENRRDRREQEGTLGSHRI
jgi:hypothetical protein